MAGKAMPDTAGCGNGGMYDRFGLFAAAAANAWNRTNPWYAGSTTDCGPGSGTSAPRTAWHQSHRSTVQHHSPVHPPPSATHMLASKKGYTPSI